MKLPRGNIKGYSTKSGLFRCGHAKASWNEQSVGRIGPPRCKMCYREKMRVYMRAYRKAHAPAFAPPTT